MDFCESTFGYNLQNNGRIYEFKKINFDFQTGRRAFCLQNLMNGLIHFKNRIKFSDCCFKKKIQSNSYQKIEFLSQEIMQN